MRKISALMLALCFFAAVPAFGKEFTDTISNVSRVIVQDKSCVTLVLPHNKEDYRLKDICLNGQFVSGEFIIKTDVPPDKLPWVKAMGEFTYPNGERVYETIVIHVRSLNDIGLR